MNIAVYGAGQLGTSVARILERRGGFEVLGPYGREQPRRGSPLRSGRGGHRDDVLPRGGRAGHPRSPSSPGRTSSSRPRRPPTRGASTRRWPTTLDALARERGVTILGGGINPGFAFDALVITATGAERGGLVDPRAAHRRPLGLRCDRVAAYRRRPHAGGVRGGHPHGRDHRPHRLSAVDARGRERARGDARSRRPRDLAALRRARGARPPRRRAGGQQRPASSSATRASPTARPGSRRSSPAISTPPRSAGHRATRSGSRAIRRSTTRWCRASTRRAARPPSSPTPWSEWPPRRPAG